MSPRSSSHAAFGRRHLRTVAIIGIVMVAVLYRPQAWLLPDQGGRSLARQLSSVTPTGAAPLMQEGLGSVRRDTTDSGVSQPFAHSLSLLMGLSAVGALVQSTRRRSVHRCASAKEELRVLEQRARAQGGRTLAELEEDYWPEEIECEIEEADAVDTVCGPSMRIQPVSRRTCVGGGLASAALAGGARPSEALLYQTRVADWEQYDLNTGETLYDIDFDPLDPDHGFCVGAHGLFYESLDGGKLWTSRSFTNVGKDDGILYRFQAVSVYGKDVWILGKPPLLLHSKDGGRRWSRVPLSRKLPGNPKVITALGEGIAEIATSSGAVYKTETDGRTWKSQVKETVDATLNRASSAGIRGASYFTGTVKSVSRKANGAYIAVAQRGNFYLTYTPGENFWVPHNRISTRRIQAMGFADTLRDGYVDGVWMTLNGGYLTVCTNNKYVELLNENDQRSNFKFAEIRSGGIGLIDIAYRTKTEAWAVGGSGVIYASADSGQTWSFDASGIQLPCNLYNVNFFLSGKAGFMIGSAGILLRRIFKEGDSLDPNQRTA